VRPPAVAAPQIGRSSWRSPRRTPRARRAHPRDVPGRPERYPARRRKVAGHPAVIDGPGRPAGRAAGRAEDRVRHLRPGCGVGDRSPVGRWSSWGVSWPPRAWVLRRRAGRGRWDRAAPGWTIRPSGGGRASPALGPVMD